MSGKLTPASGGLRRTTEAAMIAALYAAAALLLAPLSFGPLQLRAAEALTLLPVLFPSATAGLTVGCALSNAIGAAIGANPCGAADILFGSAATLLAALTARLLRRFTVTRARLPVLSALMPPLFNGLIVGLELSLVYKLPFYLCAAQVAGGELLVTLLLGLPLTAAVRRAVSDEALEG